ncbi:beta-N-acetylhexosaminidase [Pacificimonas aurantium]|uniref:beta-N-acetylhexosaminidase n=1 Tax=Pacificimonas aurantium TaxID=1250540 RepID=A0ABS7WMS9_9SPHN|nr:beta-N-acetylhexosaminidase [Pacificimonas aurantium]
MRPLVLGFAGPELTPDEEALFGRFPPAGFILFDRNIGSPRQLRMLTDRLRALTGRPDVPILIDQEGGRVQRLGPPHWPEHPPARPFGELYREGPIAALDAARFHGRAIAADLAAAGINVDCLPVLDVRDPEGHDIIGDRSFDADPSAVASLGAALLTGLREEGVCGIVKHIPGHGRARADSHRELPVVNAPREDLARDFLPFLRLADAPMAMTAHVLYAALDEARCASLSPVVIGDVIRGELAFDGFLLCDDLAMKALTGPLQDRLEGVLAAGCDAALHCTGIFAENETLLSAAPVMAERSRERLEAAMNWAEVPAADMSAEEWARRRDDLLGLLAR